MFYIKSVRKLNHDQLFLVYFGTILKILRFFIYHTVGFVCEVLICMNSMGYRGLANFNSTVMLIIIIFLSVSHCYTSHNSGHVL